MYEVTDCRILVRSSPTLENFQIVRNTYFDPWELVSVDLIRHARQDSNDGPFLRLSDGSGWILAKDDGRQLARRILVEEAPNSYWTFYVDHAPSGMIPLRRHPVQDLHNPNDNNRFSPDCGDRTYLPMQKIVCDRKVVQGNTAFYRVQGTCGWVMDRYSNKSRCRKSLIDGDLVEMGLFAFRVTATKGVSIRKSCHVGAGSNCSNVTIRCEEIVVVDTVRYSPLDHGNGPFLRLSDGSGWLFQHQHGSSPLLEEIPIKAGTFRLKILACNGIRPQGQPIRSYYYRDRIRAPVLKQNEIVVCDRKISNPSGSTFYRKQGTNLWISERDEGVFSEIVAEVLSDPDSPNDTLLGKTPRNSDGVNTLSSPWNPHFIRGNANGIYGLEEIGFDPNRNVISYKTADDVTIHVYFETRMIGIVMNKCSANNQKSQRFHRNCNDAELHAIFRDPRSFPRGGQSSKRARLMPSPIHTRLFRDDSNPELGEHPITPDTSLSSNLEHEDSPVLDSDQFVVDAEDETRRNLWDCQNELKNLRYREGNLLRAIQLHEGEHAKAARAMKLLTEQASAYRMEQEDEEDRRFRFGFQEELIEEEEGQVEDHRQSGSPSSSLVMENMYIGSMVGCFLGLVLSPVCGPFLMRVFGLEHLVV